MLNLKVDINGHVIGNVEIQNLRTNDKGMAYYRVDAELDGDHVTGFFKHQRGDGVVVCMMRAMEAIIADQGLEPTLIEQTYKDAGRI